MSTKQVDQNTRLRHEEHKQVDQSKKAEFTEEEINVAAAMAKHDVDVLFNRTEPNLIDEFKRTNFRFSTLAWNELVAQDEKSKKLSYSALASALTAQKLNGALNTNWSSVSIVESSLESICPINVIQECIPGKYRSFSGHCNNVEHPLWGAAYEPMVSASQDKVKVEKNLQVHEGFQEMCLKVPKKAHKFCTLALAQWAQFIYEDIAQIGTNQLVKGNESFPLPCCGAKHSECLPIFADADDENYKDREQCLPYARSVVAPRLNCGLGPRHQANLASSFLDASHLYGNSEDESRRLRLFVDGQLKTQTVEGEQLLPGKQLKTCTNKNKQCFDSASKWTNLLPTTAAFHTLWVRQHNRVARQLKIRNWHWNDERLYQETRRIVGAQIQHITFNEFLPIVIGKELLNRHKLEPAHAHKIESDYNMTLNPTALNAYASVFGLFFFSLIPDTIAEVSKQQEVGERQHLSALFNNVDQLYEKEKFNSLLRYLINEPIVQPGLQMSLGFRDRFLRGPDTTGIDLAAIIIQMGRDHGISSYTKNREMCGLSRPRNFEELKPLLGDTVNIEALQKVYKTVDDGDLFVLGLAEKAKKGSLLGPTFDCLLAQQFHRIKHGDRFWYGNSLGIGGFTNEQTNELRKTTLAGVFCDNTNDLGPIQPRIFEQPNESLNCPLSCNSSTIERPNFDAWNDREPEIRLPITQETVEKALKMGAEQYRRFVEAERKKLASLGKPVTRKADAIYSHARYLAPKREALDRAQIAGILRETTKILLRGDGLEEHEKLPAELDVPTLQQMLPKVDVSRVINYFEDYLEDKPDARKVCLPKPLPCDHTTKYRTPSGWCNNLKTPSYGNAFEALRRIREPAYDDGFDTPRAKSVTGNKLPSARKISVKIHNDDQQEDSHFTHMVMQFGQLIDHDLTHSPLSRGPENMILNCSTCDTPKTLSIHCFPIPIEEDDPYFPPRHTDGTARCIPMARSILAQVTLGYRNQLNQLTAFIDASHVYGSNDCETVALRSHKDGLLNFTDLGHNKQALPQGPQERLCHKNPDQIHSCFNAGDERNNIQPGLTTMHTLMLREHNMLARELQKLNSHWDDEKLFQEARRIHIAKFQHITYKEFLPVILGCEMMSRHDLWPLEFGYTNDYDSNCDPQMSQEFSIAAFRFGHTLIRNVFPRLDENYTKIAPGIELRENFNNATSLYQAEYGHMEAILMGLLGTPEMQFNRHASNAVRNHLFQFVSGPYTGLDLMAVNVQRGRDHGLQGYNSYREMYTMSDDSIEALKNVYEHVDDIDLFTGMMSEKPIKGALVGPMVAFFVAEQFRRLKRCDRFWYETGDPYLRFTPPQLAEIRKATFAKLLCENSQFAHKIQPNVFIMPNELTNAPIYCEEMPETNLHHWEDQKTCTVHGQTIPLGKTVRTRPCTSCTCTKEGAECHSITVSFCDDLLKKYPLDKIKDDMVCVVQCLHQIHKMASNLTTV
ncbi:hypothetical protein M3Y97_00283900 [Aphelenchoides bicaudatus]|nr:hypothetical protein M3Y97_00283900 [Aphelenchoides bicaudatus]